MMRKGSLVFFLVRGIFDGLDTSGQRSVHLLWGIIDPPAVLLPDKGILKDENALGLGWHINQGKRLIQGIFKEAETQGK